MNVFDNVDIITIYWFLTTSICFHSRVFPRVQLQIELKLCQSQCSTSTQHIVWQTWIDSQLSQKCFLNPIAPLWSRPMTSETIYPSEYVLVEPSTEHAYHVGKRRCDRAYHSPSDYKISSKSDHGPSADLWCHIDFQDGGCDGAVLIPISGFVLGDVALLRRSRSFSKQNFHDWDMEKPTFGILPIDKNTAEVPQGRVPAAYFVYSVV